MDDAASTIPAFLAESVALRGDERALGFIRGGELHWRTWREVSNSAHEVAAALQTAGVRPGDRVAQVSENRYEWVIADLAIHLAGAVHVPMHVTLSEEQLAEQIADCGARIVFVSSAKHWAKFRELLAPDMHLFLHDEQGKGAGEVLLGKPAVAPNMPPSVASDSLATILYTSGTTGRPRGVMLSQRNLTSNAAAIAAALGAGPENIRLGILPLSHIFARTCDLYTWLLCGSKLVLAESRDTLARDLALVGPTVFNAVPYVYQKIAAAIQAARPNDESAALRAYFGGRMERLCCGGAPLAASIELWYRERGLPILSGYGLTEASPVISASTVAACREGRVGPLLPGVEACIAADGELLVRGPNVMLGYWNDESATREAIRETWLHTGDLADIDDDGFLSIRGRKKELIVLSTGKNVSPTRVETLLTASPLIEQAVVFGDGLPALVAFVLPAAAANRDTIAAEIELRLQSAAREEQIRRFAFLDRPLSVERGELTPKLSLCRRVIAANFAALLSELTTGMEPMKTTHEI